MMSCASGSCSSGIMRLCMKTLAKPWRRLHVARAQVRTCEESLLIESAPDEYFKKGLRESLMRAVEEKVIFKKEETPEEIVWYARLNVAVEAGET